MEQENYLSLAYDRPDMRAGKRAMRVEQENYLSLAYDREADVL